MIILLHGFSGDRSSWHEVTGHWQPDQPVVALDLPGHASAPDVPSGWHANLKSIQSRLQSQLQSRLLSQSRDGVDLSDATVVGYSLGARAALGLVAAGFVRRAVLISVNPGLSDGERAGRRRSDGLWIETLRTEGIAAFAARWEAQPLFASQQRVSAELRHHRHQVRCAQSAAALARSLEEMGLAAMPDYREELGRLQGQVQLVVGAEDAKFRALAEELVERVPGLPLHVVADCGHDVPLEQPAALAALLARLVDLAWPA